MLEIYIGKKLVIAMTSNHGRYTTYCINRKAFDNGEPLDFEKSFSVKEDAREHYNTVKTILAD